MPDQNYVDPRGDVVFSCIFNTAKKMPKAAVAAVVPSVDIHFIPRPHWSDRKLCELLEYVQSFPSLRGARPYLVGEGGIEMWLEVAQAVAHRMRLRHRLTLLRHLGQRPVGGGRLADER